MSDLDQVLKRGQLLIIETGEYSDKSWDGPVRLLKSFKKSDVVALFQAQWKKSNDDPWESGPSAEKFLPWLIKRRYVEAVDNVHSWHVGYSRFEP